MGDQRHILLCVAITEEAAAAAIVSAIPTLPSSRNCRKCSVSSPNDWNLGSLNASQTRLEHIQTVRYPPDAMVQGVNKELEDGITGAR